ncbi:UDP-glucuronosyltransferase 2B1-like [Vespa mandarinia]|uniref:UDP-glucuronosyltransferase 2B1-like n=1 Tax=Vespa mandarinia TaxID=7446 RepID=UPI001610F05E|nr:UDP-glucuronosyltransferase 2B1-like [Vespa mandarinia]
MKSSIITIVTYFSILNVGLIDSARILIIISIPSYSHQIAYQSIWKTLSLRGHQITLLTSDPIPDKNLTNFRQIDISNNYKYIRSINFLETKGKYSWQTILNKYFHEISSILAEKIFDHPDFKKIYELNSGEKFDLVITEAIITPSVYVFAHRFKAPLIGTYSLGLLQMSHFAFGNPLLPSHPSTWEIDVTGSNVPFWTRVKNYVATLWHVKVDCYNIFYKPQQEIAEKYLDNIPSLKDLEKNMSIVLVNQQEEISFIRPNVPNIIHFGGLHIRNKLNPLPKALQEFVDNASNGFIYVSFGTNVHPSMFSDKLKNIFFDTLSNLSVKVVWKFTEDFPEIPNNMHVAGWFPQQEILAHPNLKLFVYQGGLQSTEEAVYSGVPLVGIPILADQDMQVNKMVSLGVCKKIDILEITKEVLNEAIIEVLNNKSYKENMLTLKKLIKDKPIDMMDKVIWWIEYVIRHKGAPHLRSSIVDEPWYQRYNTDVIAFLSVALFNIALLSLYIVHKTLVFIIKYYSTSVMDEKKKIS